MNQFKRVLVVGASRGIGAAVANHLLLSTAELITVSRTPSKIGKWIEADVSNMSGIEIINKAIAIH